MLATGGELSLDSPSHTAFVQAWEREWDRDSHPAFSDSDGQGLGAAMLTGQVHIPVEDHLQEVVGVDHQAESTRDLNPLPNEPINSVFELELMWNKWADGLQAMGLNAGQLLMDVDQAEKTASQRGRQWSTEMKMEIMGRRFYEFMDWDTTIQSLKHGGLGRRLNFPYGERYLGQRTLVLVGSPEGGLIKSIGPSNDASSSRGEEILGRPYTEHWTMEHVDGPPYKRRLMDSNHDAIVAYFSEGVAEVKGGFGKEGADIHDVGGISDSVVIVSPVGRRRRKVQHGLTNCGLIAGLESNGRTNSMGAASTLQPASSRT
ncbi:uncharacterized protein LOC114317746 [Camellia sinensis]|uniref:uncharacterized protein LOC114317746 n=1 Tax=Camellia sinensis TaxID=4442 RepID=UPI001036C2BD|nr:uncharacterized protein LOC114317746 [Camellia sinensis]